MKTTFLKLKTAVDFNAEVERSRGAEEDEENSVSLSLCDKINTEAQRHRGTETESLTFLTGLTGLTRLGNESLLCDKII